MMKNKTGSSFTRVTWGALAFNIMVILWGAYVRASSSGNGCGSHWPLCNGELFPQSAQSATGIEFIHRVSSGMVVILAVMLFIWAWRKQDRKSLLRWSTGGVLLFTITEALVGAALVLFHLTGTNESVERAVVIVIHQVNTFMLLASLALTAWWSTFGEPRGFGWKGSSSGLLLAAVLGLVFLGGSGAITALGDTLFPATSLTQGFQQDSSSSVSFLLRLRIYHPLAAVTLAIYGGLILRWLREKETNPLAKRLVSGVMGLFCLQLVLGGFNVVLLAPEWLQMIHLLVMDLIWTGSVLVFSLNLSCFLV